VIVIALASRSASRLLFAGCSKELRSALKDDLYTTHEISFSS